MQRRVEIFDSTLRDGAQGEGVSFSVADKLKIARALDAMGIDYIEAGNPFSNPKDMEFFQRAGEAKLQKARLVAFGSTRRKDARPQADAGLAALLAAGTEYVCIFGKTSPTQVRRVLGATPEENLSMIRQSVEYLCQNDRKVFFDAEHFFDGFGEDAAYALACLHAARQAGACAVCLCDTNGATYMTDIYEATKRVTEAMPGVNVGIHCHNDLGMAVAGSMMAVDAGASHVQGTFLGFGERCGNANLSTIIANLSLKRGIPCIPEEKLPRLTHTAHRIAEIANVNLSARMPYVGADAFAHKGGMHIDAVTKYPASFEHIAPEAVGNHRKLIVSEVAGKTALMEKLRGYDPTLEKDSLKTREIIERLKALEYRGYQFEAAEESFELVIRRALGLQKKYFELDYFKIIGEQPLFSRLYPSSAMIKVRVGSETELAAAEGDGPVHAIDMALRRALTRFYPQLEDMRLTDFKVRVLEADATTAATVRVLIESSDSHASWTTIGVSTDILEASFLALADSIEYKLTKDERAEEV